MRSVAVWAVVALLGCAAGDDGGGGSDGGNGGNTGNGAGPPILEDSLVIVPISTELTPRIDDAFAKAGEIFLVVGVELENRTDGSLPLAPAFFAVQTAAGLEFGGDAVATGQLENGCAPSSSLAPEGKTSCGLAFAVPENIVSRLIAYNGAERYEADLDCQFCSGVCVSAALSCSEAPVTSCEMACAVIEAEQLTCVPEDDGAVCSSCPDYPTCHQLAFDYAKCLLTAQQSECPPPTSAASSASGGETPEQPCFTEQQLYISCRYEIQQGG
jgi:hypothetical protein